MIISKALVYTQHGSPLKVLKFCRIPLIMKNDFVHLKIIAASINPSDINQIQGVYPLKPTWHPHHSGPSHFDKIAVGGMEGVGVITGLGAHVNPRYKLGDWLLPIDQSFNTWQTDAVVDPRRCLQLRDPGITKVQAATMSVNHPSALLMLEKFVKLEKGQGVIQNAANSALGQSVVQLCKHFGYKSVNVIRDGKNAKVVQDALYGLGADLVLTQEQLRNEATRQSVKLVNPVLGLNGVGGESATNIARLLSDKGHLVTYGGMSKEPVTIPTSLFIFKKLTAHGFWLSKYLKESPLETRLGLNTRVLRLLRDASITAPWHQEYSWADGFSIEGLFGNESQDMTRKKILVS